MEHWKEIPEFPGYSVSSRGRIMNTRTERILRLSQNQSDTVTVGLMKDGKQLHRSVALLVATAFIPQLSGVFDTPICLDGDRKNLHEHNLMWRPRWYAVSYNQQFEHPYAKSIHLPVENLSTKERHRNSWEAAIYNGVLEKDLVLSILNHTFCWPLYQQFRVIPQ